MMQGKVLQYIAPFQYLCCGCCDALIIGFTQAEMKPYQMPDSMEVTKCISKTSEFPHYGASMFDMFFSSS